MFALLQGIMIGQFFQFIGQGEVSLPVELPMTLYDFLWRTMKVRLTVLLYKFATEEGESS
uniref:Uncharacterized protein n=1 Tax=Medicago truncatula TaxID=3880 RepID=B7FJY7_MEDTR|nr:unknown [Medicago truncatula]